MSEPQTTCVQCGKPASHFVHDQKETAPGKWESDGGMQAFCAEHARSQQLTFVDGTRFIGGKKVS